MIPRTIAKRVVAATSSGSRFSRGFSTLTPGSIQSNRPAIPSVAPAAAYELLSRSSNRDEIHGRLAYCLSFAPADHTRDFLRNFNTLVLDERMEQQLANSEEQLMRPTESRANTVDEQPLPKTFADAIRPSKRAIVVTEAVAPFRVVDVNDAWTDLCGYSFLEAKDQTLGKLLSGPETDRAAATQLVMQVLAGNEAATVLTNYTKSSRSFRNRIRVGPLVDIDNGIKVTHFVGVLQEVAPPHHKQQMAAL